MASLWSLALLAAPASAQQPVAAPPHFAKLAHTLQHRSLGPGHGRSGRRGTAWGERGLELIAQGASAEKALRIAMRTDTMLQDRQVGMVDARGRAASFTGTFDWAGGRVGAPAGHGNVPGGKGEVIVGHGFAAQANIMDGKIDRVELEDILRKRASRT